MSGIKGANMKFNRYWVRETGRVRVDGGEQPVTVYGGSNLSPEAAREDARRRIAAVQRRIDGEPDAREAYEAAIREEVVREIDGRNLLSRTRYGALILNSEDTFFIDIDRPPARFWKALFAWRKLDAKQRIVAHIAGLAATPRYGSLGIRVYETAKGIRAIVSGAGAAPGSDASQQILSAFNADPLYTRLCAKQGCYRARVTPKPHRVRCRAHKVTWPRDDAAQAAFATWLADYEAKSARYAVCRFLQEFGTPQRSRIIDLHDELTRANSRLPLA